MSFLCDTDDPFNFRDQCIRISWAAILPASLTFLFILISFTPIPKPLQGVVGFLKKPFLRFLPLHEAEALDNTVNPKIHTDDDTAHVQPTPPSIPLWRTLVFTFLGLFQSLSWLALASFQLFSLELPSNGTDTISPTAILHPFLISFSWLYTSVRPVTNPKPTPSYDVFAIYIAHVVGGIILWGGMLFDYYVPVTGGLPTTPPSIATATALTVNLLVALILVGVVLAMPLAVPSERVDKNQIGFTVSPEDYTTLLGWVTFSWVRPLVKLGRDTTLEEKDVWPLSLTMQSRPVFIKFNTFHEANLLKKIWLSNSLDFMVDAVLTFLSIGLNYSGPFFLKRILDLIDLQNPTPESRARAYIYAFLAFSCSLLKAQADVQHLWIGRRATTRIRSELMASIYDKALKRKDFSGIIDKEKQAEARKAAKATAAASAAGGDGTAISSTTTTNGKDKKKGTGATKKDKKQLAKEEQEAQDKADDPKAGAGVGKIVNLMAGDASQISQTLSILYLYYGAPFEIIIAGTFLYRLLGWSAFAGFFTMVLGWPLNSYITRRSVRIQKGEMAAQDKRMNVLNELIGSIKFIKFFAWEGHWIDRAMEARNKEMQWMVKSCINSIMFRLIWSGAPILVSVISFLAYVAQGNQLTISVAFTAIALFNMIRLPLNILPTWIVQIVQTGVSLKRITVYLGEDEVSSQVSSLKREQEDLGSRPPQTTDQAEGEGSEEGGGGFGLRNASFKWNEIEKVTEASGTSPGSPVTSTSTATATKAGGNSGDDSTSIAVTIVDEAGSTVGLETETESVDMDHKFELRDISVVFPERALTLVTGPTASGKTALLMAVLGELTTLSGEILMSKDISRVDEFGYMHAISYAAQTPWLRHQSIKDNVLFGYPYDEERYEAVIECCALRPDLDMLEDGDATEIGARGVSLSGGQKARVALARAVYARTRYVLLDDPLSAVDSHTSRFLYERLLCGPLLANRTVVLVTHHVELVMPGAHYLVRMLDGRIDTQGTIKDLRAQGILEAITHDATVEAVHKEELVASEDVLNEGDEVTAGVSTVTVPGTSDAAVAEVAAKKKPKKLIKDEHREVGGVKWSIYNSYLKASSYWVWAILALLVVMNQLLAVGEKLWVKTWGEAYGPQNGTTFAFVYSTHSSHGRHVLTEGTGYLTSHQIYTSPFRPFGIFDREWPSAVEHPLYYIGIYAAIGLAGLVVNVLSSTAQYIGALRASRLLFRQLLVAVVRATFRFHDTTPQGRMLNRFGKDIDTIDGSLAQSLQAVNSSLASFFAAMITVAVIFPWFLIPAFFIGIAFRELAIGYLNTGRDLRRMESNSRSPIFSDFGELLEGIVTVRAFSAERRFLDGLHQKIDITTKMWYSFWMTNRWLLLNFDVLGAIAVLVTTLFSIATLSNGAGLAGLCITSAMAFTSSVYWACRFWTGLELDLNSVERVVEYLDLPQEPPPTIESNRVPAYWPSSSNKDSLISVENLSIKYAPDLPAVLHDVSFTLKAGERIGLLGRTGSGKSTLAMSILRFVDPAEGRIVIDGIDISTIGIHDLRSRLTFIPQDATLFSGTLRENLDPFGEHDDSECNDVLRRVQMITSSRNTSRMASRYASPSSSRPASIHISEHLNESPSEAASIAVTDVDTKTTVSLDTVVSAGGTNFSQGQRQLIAMARALLRRSAIIVLDEATSSIDFATDAKIQATIRKEFNDSLLLTVAHRLRTVIDYDRLIVLDKGEIAEFDTPWNLIRKEDGIFRGMCMKSGSFGELETAAKLKAEKEMAVAEVLT